MAEDGRKIGEYKVTNALHMGDKEYALCENMDDPHGLYLLNANRFCHSVCPRQSNKCPDLRCIRFGCRNIGYNIFRRNIHGQ